MLRCIERQRMPAIVVHRGLAEIRRFRWLVLGLLALALLLAIAVSLSDALAFPGFDLRPKVVGARALLLGLDPYLPETLRWTAATPPALTDTETVFYADTGLARVTYPPSLLLLYMPFATLPYDLQRLLWWALEWTALLTSIGVLCAATPRRFRLAFLIAAIGAFACSYFWRWHAERGQYYVFLVLLLSLDLFALRSGLLRQRSWLGAPTGVAITFRPTFAVLVPLLWFMGERRAAVTAVLAAAMVMAASLPFAGVQEWQHYFDNVATMARQVAEPVFSVRLPPPEGASYFVEGYDFYPTRELVALSRNLTFSGLLHRPWALPLSGALAVLVSVGVVAAMLWLRTARGPRELTLLLFATTPVLLDYTVPVRWSYVDVVFLPVLAVLIPAVLRYGGVWTLGSVAAALLASFYGMEGLTVGLLRQLFFLLAVGLSAVALWRSAPSS